MTFNDKNLTNLDKAFNFNDKNTSQNVSQSEIVNDVFDDTVRSDAGNEMYSGFDYVPGRKLQNTSHSELGNNISSRCCVELLERSGVIGPQTVLHSEFQVQSQDLSKSSFQDESHDGLQNTAKNEFISKSRSATHKPVMLGEVLHYLEPKSGEIYIDCTFGAGGYSSAILGSCDCSLIGIDQDQSVVKFAEKVKDKFKERFIFVNENFGNLEEVNFGKIIRNEVDSKEKCYKEYVSRKTDFVESDLCKDDFREYGAMRDKSRENGIIEYGISGYDTGEYNTKQRNDTENDFVENYSARTNHKKNNAEDYCAGQNWTEKIKTNKNDNLKTDIKEDEKTSNIKINFEEIKNHSQLNSDEDDFLVCFADGIVFDLGVSSMQLEEAERGFSFRLDSKLDMRMSQDSDMTAYDVVNFMSEQQLADIIYYNGEEVKAKKIAKYIVEHRKVKKIESTLELAEIIYKVIPKRFYQKIDPATKTFQAIRIYLNDELNNLKKALNYAHKLLKKGGRLIVVSFHSLEDKIIKDHLRLLSEPKVSVSKYHKNKHDDENESSGNFVYKIISKKPFTPTNDEIYANQRSRSAKMRVAVKI